MTSPPLAGLRVLDFTRVLAGPYLTELLAALGAEIVKIEPPDGDPTRHQGEPTADGASYYFHGCNAGKRSVVLDLREEAGRELALRLVEKADVFIENFRPGVLDRLTLGSDAIRARNPRCIQLSISAFGKDADPAERDRPSFDLCTQARGGTLSINGDPNGPPSRMAIPMGDLAGSFYGAIALLSALWRRDRVSADPPKINITNNSPTGELIDLSLLDAQIALLGNWVPLSVMTGKSPGPVGSAHASAAPYDLYQASDGYFVVAVFTERFWPLFAKAVSLESLLNDPRFVNSNARVAHRAELDSILRPRFLLQTREYWLSRLREADVPAEPVANVLEALRDPAYSRREMLKYDLYTHKAGGEGESRQVPRAAFPAKFNHKTYFPSRRAPAALGGDTGAVLLEWLDISPSERERYHSRGAFGPPSERGR